jgi:phage terminase large subunit-like protein
MATIETTQPWEAYARGSDGADFAAFCEHYVIQSVDEFAGEPLVLEGWQQQHIGEALAYDEQLRPVWRVVLLVICRKNGKTALLAAYALFRLLTDVGKPEIILAASSDEQADRLFEAIVSYLNRNPELAEHCVVRDYVGEIARSDGDGIIKRLSSDPKRAHGYNPSIVVCDELAQWTTPTLHKTWAALTTGGGARKRAQVFAITTAGEAVTREDGILGQLLDRGAETGEVEHRAGLDIIRSHETRTLAINYSAPMPAADPGPVRSSYAAYRRAKEAGRGAAEARALYEAAARRCAAAMKLANPATWVSEEYLLEQALAPSLGASDVLQLHAGVWATGEHAWMSRDDWRAAYKPDRLAEGEPITLGFDGSRFYDATALVACRMSDGWLCPLAVWEAPRGGGEWEVPRNEVDAEVAEAMRTYVVARMYADPPYWQSEIADWTREWGDKVVVPWETNRVRAMGAALERFETDLSAGLVTHDGNEPLLRHVTNAVRTKTRSGYLLDKPARNSDRKIDMATAAVLAYEARCDAIADGWRARSRKVYAF